MTKYQYGISINGMITIQNSREHAERALADTLAACRNDPTVVKLVRRPLGEWEEVF